MPGKRNQSIMTLILNIDTATEKASICLAGDAAPLITLYNEQQQDHASWLHSAVEQMMSQAGYGFKDLEAVAVTAGPGSYTGLRIGMTAAKGFCYVLHIPLVTVNTLYVMAFAGSRQHENKKTLLCPMIDARRMEVFTALYDGSLAELIPPSALILDEHSFAGHLAENEIVFFGNGSKKWQQLTTQSNAIFGDFNADARYLATLSFQKFTEKRFTDIIYAEPIYLKEFYTQAPKTDP
jgi:tRNA threonylcarbamoyladenosine biosynthesis protein TsaB